MNYGWSPSLLDGTEHIATYDNADMPDAFSFKDAIPPALNQGATSTCVPHACSAIYDWMLSLQTGVPASYGMSIYNIYDRRQTRPAEGMSFKNALHDLLHIGAVKTDEYKRDDFSRAWRIKEYAMVRNLISLKNCVMMNGPVLIATLVRDPDSARYWNGSDNYGGHAVCCVGWDRKGLIIRNSWGRNWGIGGYTRMPYDEFGAVIEAWTAIL